MQGRWRVLTHLSYASLKVSLLWWPLGHFCSWYLPSARSTDPLVQQRVVCFPSGFATCQSYICWDLWNPTWKLPSGSIKDETKVYIYCLCGRCCLLPTLRDMWRPGTWHRVMWKKMTKSLLRLRCSTVFERTMSTLWAAKFLEKTQAQCNLSRGIPHVRQYILFLITA